MWRLCVFLVFCLSVNRVGAQTAFEIEVGGVGGFLMPHHSDMDYLVDGHIRGIEAALHFPADGSKDWHHHFNFPSWGVSASVYDLGSPRLGTGGAALAFLDMPLDGRRRFGITAGIGAGYVSRPFDPETNFHNGAIGSRLNSALEMTAYGRITFSERWTAKAGIGVRHFSNGSMQVPNSGINLAVAKIAVQYSARNAAVPERRVPDTEKETARIYAGGSGGLKQALPYGSSRHAVGNAFLNYQKRATAKSGWGFEAGINYNAALSSRAEDAGRVAASTENLRAYLAAQYMLHLDPFALRFQAGSYLFPEFEDDGLVFFKYHLLYSLDKWQFFVGLKSHFAKADNIELGIAYRIK
ncbi:MAG: acyloxyacyl hydrolase [Flavobacteriales bacterium]|nr:acyloxyacyl hydrolase [Flavobacteriales bacterium]